MDLNGKILRGTGTNSIITVEGQGRLILRDSSDETHCLSKGDDGIWTWNDAAPKAGLKSIPAGGAVVAVSGSTFRSGKGVLTNFKTVEGMYDNEKVLFLLADDITDHRDEKMASRSSGKKGDNDNGLVDDDPLPAQSGTSSSMKYEWLYCYDEDWEEWVIGYGFDIKGIHNGNIIQTTYGNYGYEYNIKVGDVTYGFNFDDWDYGDSPTVLGKVYTYDGIQVKQHISLIDNGQIVKFGYTLYNNSSEVKTIKIGNHTDTKIGDNDKAAVYLTNAYQEISMTDDHAAGYTSYGEPCTSYGLKYTISADEDSPFTGAYIGNYRNTYDQSYYFSVPESTADQSVTNTDSGCAFHWKKTLQPGQTTSVWCYFEIAPALVIEAVKLTADAQYKKVHFDIPYKDLPNTTQTLYYTLEGNEPMTQAGNTNGLTPDGEGFAHTSFEFDSPIIDWEPNKMRTIALYATDNRGYTSKHYTFNVWWPDYKPESAYSTVYFENTTQHFANVRGGVGSTITLPSDSDEGRTFTGWNTKLDGTGTSYAAGANYTIPAEDSYLFAQWKISVDKLTVTADDQEYTGSAVETVKVKYGSTTLTAGVDYDIQYQNNVNVGQASATISGSKLEGTKTVNFNILRRMLTVTITPNGGTYDAVIPATAVFNNLVSGDEVIPVLTYTGTSCDGQETVNGTTPPTHAGTYTVTATLPETTAASNYLLNGTNSTNFVIAKANNSWTTEPSVASVPLGTEVAPVSVAKYGEATVVYRGVNGTSYGPITIKPTAAGYYKATFSIAETCNYLRIDADDQFTIYVAEVSVGTEVTGYYPTVQDAIYAASGKTVKPIIDVTESVTVESGRTLTLDLNGKTITSANGGTTITNSGTLTVTDSSEGNGIIKGAETGAGIVNSSTGALNLYAGEVKDNVRGVDNGGTLTLGGKVKITGNAANLYLPEGKVFIVDIDDNVPATGMMVGVTPYKWESGSIITVSTANSTTDYSQYFRSDNEAEHFVVYADKEDEYKLKITDDVKVILTADPEGIAEVKIYNATTGAEITDPEHIHYGTMVTIKVTSVEQGWAFKGWFHADGSMFNGKYEYTFKATQNLNLTAKFTNQVIWVRVKKGN